MTSKKSEVTCRIVLFALCYHPRVKATNVQPWAAPRLPVAVPNPLIQKKKKKEKNREENPISGQN